MIERVLVDLRGAKVGLRGAMFRYEVLGRLSRCTVERQVQFLAFGFGNHRLRVVLEGDESAIGSVIRGVKVGTIRAAARWGLTLHCNRTTRAEVPEGGLEDAVVWAHRAPVDEGTDSPLASPWSSHRDLVGFRRAAFYDPAVLDGRIDVHRLQLACGGEPLPARWARARGSREDLSYLLRLAGAVAGVLPADRKCFRLFVHLAKARGWATAEVAEALALSPRRVRQLAADAEPDVDIALMALGDQRLSRVP